MKGDENNKALGPGEEKLEDPDTKKVPTINEDKGHKTHTVDKLISKFFHLGHKEPEQRVTTDVATSERVLEAALANNNQPAIPPDASLDHESGSQKGEKIAAEAKELFLAAKIDVHAIALEQRGHAETLCNTMDIRPFDVLCFIGGDGTFHECVNGLLKRSDGMGGTIPIAMIAGGTGNSFSLELLGDTDVKLAVETIIRGIHAPVDVGKIVQLDVTDAGKLGNEIIYSFNSIHWGLASKVSMTAEKLRWMGKAVRYTTAALMEMFNGDSSWAAVQFEDSEGNIVEYKEKFCLAIANTAKGMKMAPKAKLNDGLIDLLLIRSHKTMDLLSIFSKVYNGTHTDLEYVEYKQVKWFSIVPFTKDGEVVLDEENCEEVVDIDGELKGATPFRCEVIRNAIKVII